MAVHAVGGHQRQQPGLLDLAERSGDVLAHGLVLAQAPAEGRARFRRAGTSCSSARCAQPIRRMQWWMRPGPSRPCAISKPRPSPSRTLAPARARSRTRSPARRTGIGVAERGDGAHDAHARRGHGHQDHRLPAVAVRVVRVGLAHDDQDAGSSRACAPVVNHLRPLITYSSPSRRIVHSMLVASEEATPAPSSRSRSGSRPPAAAPATASAAPPCRTCISVSMLPVSGALQLNTSGRPHHPAHDLGERRVLEVGELPAVLMRVEQVPEPGCARLGLERPPCAPACARGSPTAASSSA